MAHTCPECQETFETLSRLRLHDCPGPTTPDHDLGRALVDATERGLERGDVVEPLPDRPILPEVIEQWEDADGVVSAFSVMSGSPDQAETELFGVATVAGAYVIEFFPNEGWIVVRASPAGDKSDDELREELLDLVREWQATITELVLEHAPDREGHAEALLREIGHGP